MSNLRHLFAKTDRIPHEWTDYERGLREAMAYAERKEWGLALASVAYASTLPDSKRPSELERRALFRELTDSAGVWRSE